MSAAAVNPNLKSVNPLQPKLTKYANPLAGYKPLGTFEQRAYLLFQDMVNMHMATKGKEKFDDYTETTSIMQKSVGVPLTHQKQDTYKLRISSTAKEVRFEREHIVSCAKCKHTISKASAVFTLNLETLQGQDRRAY